MCAAAAVEMVACPKADDGTEDDGEIAQAEEDAAAFTLEVYRLQPTPRRHLHFLSESATFETGTAVLNVRIAAQ